MNKTTKPARRSVPCICGSTALPVPDYRGGWTGSTPGRLVGKMCPDCQKPA